MTGLYLISGQFLKISNDSLKTKRKLDGSYCWPASLKWCYIMYLTDTSLKDDANLTRFMPGNVLFLASHGNRPHGALYLVNQ